MVAPLSTDLSNPDAVPYFLWDDPMTVRELEQRLRSASESESDRLLGKVLREARDTDVWRFTTPEEVLARWDRVSPHLGRRREFWRFMLDAFCLREPEFFLTGGGALVGYHLGHRTTEDLDLFVTSDLLDSGASTLAAVALELGATLESIRTAPTSRRFPSP